MTQVTVAIIIENRTVLIAKRKPAGRLANMWAFPGDNIDGMLNLLIDNGSLADNIACALQASDLYNYYIKKYDINWSAGSIFIRNAIVNEFPIVEGLLSGCMESLHSDCIRNAYISR